MDYLDDLHRASTVRGNPSVEDGQTAGDVPRGAAHRWENRSNAAALVLAVVCAAIFSTMPAPRRPPFEVCGAEKLVSFQLLADG